MIIPYAYIPGPRTCTLPGTGTLYRVMGRNDYLLHPWTSHTGPGPSSYAYPGTRVAVCCKQPHSHGPVTGTLPRVGGNTA
eukprot:2527609-Rhodomonas_salina.3